MDFPNLIQNYHKIMANILFRLLYQIGKRFVRIMFRTWVNLLCHCLILKNNEEPAQPFVCRNLIIHVKIKNDKEDICTLFYALVFKRMKAVAHITNTTKVLPGVPVLSVFVITYYLLCPVFFHFEVSRLIFRLCGKTMLW